MLRRTLVFLLPLLLVGNLLPISAQVDEAQKLSVIETRFQANDLLQVPVLWSPDGLHLAGITQEGVVIWDALTGEETASFITTNATAIGFSPDGKLLAISNPGNILVFDMSVFLEIGIVDNSNVQEAIFEQGLVRNVTAYEEPNTFKITKIAFSPDSSALLALGFLPLKLLAFDIREPQDMSLLESAEAPFLPTLSYSGEYKFQPDIISTSVDGVRLLDISDSASYAIYNVQANLDEGNLEIQNIVPPIEKFPDSSSMLVRFSPNGEAFLMSDESGNKLMVADLSSNQRTELATSDGESLIVAVAVSGQWVATYHRGIEGVQIWDVQSPDAPALSIPETPFLRELQFSPTGDKLLMANVGEVEIWQLPSHFAVSVPQSAPQSEAAACNFEFDVVQGLLTEAEDLAASGDTEAALQNMSEAQALLSEIQAVCANQESSEPTVAVGSVENSGGTLTFSYPSDRFSNQSSEDFILIATTEELAGYDMGVELPEVPLGENLMAVGIIRPHNYGQGDIAKTATPAELANAIVETAPEFLGETEGMVEINVGKRDAAHIIFRSETNDVMFLLVALGTDPSGDQQFGQVVVITASGEIGTHMLDALVLAETFDFQPE